MLVIVLTGSIGMGKSTTAAMFARRGVPVADSDAIVHALYRGSAAPLIEAAFPGTTGNEGVDRAKLSEAVMGSPEALKQLERIVHPLVRAEQHRFIAASRAKGTRQCLLDIPLAFETGAGTDLADVVVVVSASADEQRRRVLARPGMTEAKFEHILSRQMPDSQKRQRAHWVLRTDHGLAAAEHQVAGFLRAISAMPGKK